jgi:hypothetical protein
MVNLTVDECLKIVRISTKSAKVEVKNFSTVHFGDFLGFLGEYYRLIITATVDGGAPSDLQFFVKSLPIKDLRSRRSMLISSGIFKKEAKIYENLLSKFVDLDEGGAPWCPQVCLVRDDLIVFNDLTLEGFTVLPDTAVDFEDEYVEATLRSLASYHACSIAFERKEGVTIGEAYGEILFETSIKDIPWFHAGLRTIQKVAETKFKVESSEDFYGKIFDTKDTMEESPFDIPRVLCHRDTWKNNLMFRRSEDGRVDCVLIDFQTARYLPLTVDVNMAVILTTRRAKHAAMRSHFLQFYYENLSERLRAFGIDLKSLMSLESFEKGCEFHKRLFLVYKAIAVMLTQVPQELFEGFSEVDYRDFGQGDRCRLVLRFMEQNEFFKECLVEAVGGVVEEFC